MFNIFEEQLRFLLRDQKCELLADLTGIDAPVIRRFINGWDRSRRIAPSFFERLEKFGILVDPIDFIENNEMYRYNLAIEYNKFRDRQLLRSG